MAKPSFVTAAVLALPFVVGCGRRATERDCTAIIDRMVELELKAMNRAEDPGVVLEQKVRVRGAFEAQLKDCVGRRVSDAMLKCVETASSADEVLKCVR